MSVSFPIIGVKLTPSLAALLVCGSKDCLLVFCSYCKEQLNIGNDGDQETETMAVSQ